MGAAVRSAPIFATVALLSVCTGVFLVQAPEVAGQSRDQIMAPIAEGMRIQQLASDLETRRDRQLRAGLADDAARTSRELEELTRSQIQKCRQWWEQSDSLERGVVPKNRISNVKTLTKLAGECLWRPGTTASSDASSHSDANEPTEDAAALRLNEELQGSFRQLYFVEPVPPSGSLIDPDLFNELWGSYGAAIQASPTLRRLSEEAGRTITSDPDRADSLLGQLVDALQRAPDTKPAVIAMVLEMRRANAEYRGSLPAALEYATTQLNLLERAFGPSAVELCPVLWSTSALLASMQQPQRAVETANRCLTLAASRGQASVTYGSALSALGVVYHRTGALDRAVESYDKSLAVFERITAPRVAAMQPTLMVHANLGLAHFQRGDLAQSSRHLREARQLLMKAAPSAVTETGALRGLAQVSRELDFFVTVDRAAARASPAGEATVALPLLLERKSFGLAAKTATMKTLAAEPGRLQEYRALLARRASLAHPSGSDPATTATEPNRRGVADEIDRQIVAIEAEASQRSLETAMRESIFGAPDPRRAEYAKATEDLFQKRLAEYQKRLPKKERDDIPSAAMEEIQSQVQAELYPKFKDVPGVFSMQQLQGARESLLSAIQGTLADSSALVEIVRFRPFKAAAAGSADAWEPARYGGYVVRRNGSPSFVELGEAAAIDDLVVEFRRTLAVPRGTLVHDLGRRLDALLMQPIRARIGSATQIHLSPDGLLNLVPFGALVDERDRYLIESFTFNYVSSGRDLIRETSTVRSSPPVVIADPLFDADGTNATASLNSPIGTHFDSLPGTAAEAQAIRGLLPNAAMLTRERATESAIKSVSAPRILHIATHGFFLEAQDFSTLPSSSLEDPMLRAGLVFAGANAGRSGNDDGLLTALEATALLLNGTDLVVLSACETGVGDVQTGEGVFGLRRAFIAAGAGTLVMSLWRVDDDATQTLMADFYRRLGKGEGRAAALRQSALSLLHDPEHRHPFYWASFIASGEAGPLRR